MIIKNEKNCLLAVNEIGWKEAYFLRFTSSHIYRYLRGEYLIFSHCLGRCVLVKWRRTKGPPLLSPFSKKGRKNNKNSHYLLSWFEISLPEQYWPMVSINIVHQYRLYSPISFYIIVLISCQVSQNIGQYLKQEIC